MWIVDGIGNQIWPKLHKNYMRMWFIQSQKWEKAPKKLRASFTLKYANKPIQRTFSDVLGMIFDGNNGIWNCLKILQKIQFWNWSWNHSFENLKCKWDFHFLCSRIKRCYKLTQKILRHPKTCVEAMSIYFTKHCTRSFFGAFCGFWWDSKSNMTMHKNFLQIFWTILDCIDVNT